MLRAAPSDGPSPLAERGLRLGASAEASIFLLFDTCPSRHWSSGVLHGLGHKGPLRCRCVQFIPSRPAPTRPWASRRVGPGTGVRGPVRSRFGHPRGPRADPRWRTMGCRVFVRRLKQNSISHRKRPPPRPPPTFRCRPVFKGD